MKMILTFLFIVIPAFAFCQFANGTITYSMTMKSVKDDAAAKSSQFAGMGPDEMIVAHRGASAIMTWKKGGQVTEQFLTIDTSTYMLDASNKIAYKLQQPKSHKALDEITVSKINEFQTILGHRCQKYLVSSTKGRTNQNVWAAADMELPSDVMAIIMKKSGSTKFASQIHGMPLKVESGNEQYQMVMQATNISKNAPAASELQVPAGYEVKPFGLGAITKGVFKNLFRNKPSN